MIGLNFGVTIQGIKGYDWVQTYLEYKRRVEADGGVMYSSKDCTLTSINNLKSL